MNSSDICKTVLISLAGIAWCLGHHFGWAADVTHSIGVAFWLIIIIL